MQNRIEPPILISRVLTFVFATVLVVLGVMGWTLYKMFPLDRPQVFFLTTELRRDIDVTLASMPADASQFELYKQRFIREYIRARNEITSDRGEMIRKWTNGIDGVVNTWSSQDVYSDFQNTGMWGAIVSDNVPDRAFECTVEFHDNDIDVAKIAPDSYSVKFRYFCGDDYEKLQSDYTINVKLDFGAPSAIHWTDRRDNPLGIRVVGYTIQSGNGDPLDMQHLSNATPVQ